MAICPVITNVSADLRRKYDVALATKKVAPVREFRTVSLPLGTNGKRRYFVADDNGKPIESLGYVDATPTVAD